MKLNPAWLRVVDPQWNPSCTGFIAYLLVRVRHLTPASSACTQLCTPTALAGQASSLVSVPTHRTLSNQIWPAPLVKPVVRATAPVNGNHHYKIPSTAAFSTVCTGGWESQLSACYGGTRNAPNVITHCAPDIVVADLHTPGHAISSSLESQEILGTTCMNGKMT